MSLIQSHTKTDPTKADSLGMVTPFWAPFMGSLHGYMTHAVTHGPMLVSIFKFLIICKQEGSHFYLYWAPQFM